MKVAVFHNYMDNIGGAEIVGLTMARELKAPIYSTNFDDEKIRKMGFKNTKLISIGKVPINPPYKQQMALHKFRKLDLGKQFDFYINEGDWAMSSLVNHKPNLWYVHSPIRELWDLYEYTRQSNVPPYKRPIFDLWVKYNRHLSLKYVGHAQKIVCNSNNTRRRLKKFLKVDGNVIHPPIETKRFKFIETGDFWLSVNRLITHKRVQLQMEAFKKMPKQKLIVVGSYEQSTHFKEHADYIRSIKPDNVEILNWVSNKDLIGLYGRCKGFITTSKDEDFGMTPVEAMAAGKPVIAPNEGGYKESVIDETTGVLIDDISPSKIIKAVKTISKGPGSYRKECLKQAKKFDTKVFIRKLKDHMEL